MSASIGPRRTPRRLSGGANRLENPKSGVTGAAIVSPASNDHVSPAVRNPLRRRSPRPTTGRSPRCVTLTSAHSRRTSDHGMAIRTPRSGWMRSSPPMRVSLPVSTCVAAEICTVGRVAGIAGTTGSAKSSGGGGSDGAGLPFGGGIRRGVCIAGTNVVKAWIGREEWRARHSVTAGFVSVGRRIHGRRRCGPRRGKGRCMRVRRRACGLSILRLGGFTGGRHW